MTLPPPGPRQLPVTPRRGALLLLVLGAALATASVQRASAATRTASSSNWSGYAVTGASYADVTATWSEPRADCKAAEGGLTASAFWVGLGGDSASSDALEQAGTEADCSAQGAASYFAWYELVPAAAVRVALPVAPGDRIRATVSVAGTRVTLRLENLTTHSSHLSVVAMAEPDTSSAEWIAEAPSAVTGGGTEVLPLTDFGSVMFAAAHATTSSGQTGSIGDRAWAATRIELASRSSGGFGGFGVQASVTEAVPGVLVHGGTGFNIGWRQLRTSGTPSGPPAFATALSMGARA